MALLEVRDLTKNFGATQVLRGVSFDLEKGSVLSIIGSSGGGKTTLLRCLNFLETPTSGSIRVAGQTIFDGAHPAALSDAQLRSNRLHFGLVFQSFNLFPQYSVLRNVTLAMDLLAQTNAKEAGQPLDRKQKAATHEANEARAKELIDKVGLSAKLANYPCELSGGQCQRVAIARALALQPDILCFDEPTSALDPELTGEVLKVIRELKDTGTTMIIVTHEMEFAHSVSDQVIFMADGVIAEQGTPEAVFEHPKNPKMQAFLAKSLERV
jgi:polar amino acid transport system ATP-binding protein